MSAARLVLRADGGSDIGLGHISRALALAEMFSGSREILLYTRCSIEDVQRTIAEHAQLVVMDQSVGLDEEAGLFAASLTSDATVVLDGEQFDERYQAALKRRGCTVVCIDDLATRRFCADLIINGDGGVTESRYPTVPPDRLCVGPGFAILRAPFLAAARRRQPFVPNDDILVSLGGADPNNHVIGVLTWAAESMPGRRFHVVLGAAYAHRPALEKFLSQCSLAVNLYSAISATTMAGLMSRCSTAITAASTVAYEYASVGGVLYLQRIVDDQAFAYEWFIREGLAFAFGEALPSPAAQLVSVERQRELFDGRSDERLHAAIDAISHA